MYPDPLGDGNKDDRFTLRLSPVGDTALKNSGHLPTVKWF